VLVTPSLKAQANAGKRQIAHARQVRAVAQQAVPTARVAGALVLLADIVGSIIDDGQLAALLSLAAVALLVLLLLRSARDAAWVIGSLLLGVLWLFGGMGLLGLKLNFVNFVVLPITFGIGADYAVNLYARHLQLGGRAVALAVASAGGAIALCSCTTIIGYSSLLVADNRALFSFGLMAVLGEVTCLSAALIALPALWLWRGRRAGRS
jgi:predicted RND superfamily exporter protein